MILEVWISFYGVVKEKVLLVTADIVPFAFTVICGTIMLPEVLLIVTLLLGPFPPAWTPDAAVILVACVTLEAKAALPWEVIKSELLDTWLVFVGIKSIALALIVSTISVLSIVNKFCIHLIP